MTTFFLILCLIVIGVAPTHFSFAQTPQKRTLALEKVAALTGPPYFATIAAQVKTGINKELGLAKLDTLLTLERGDMFWMYGCAGLYFSCKKELPDSYKWKIRNAWKKCTPYRGDTENHFLMYYSSLYLMSQEWPSLPEGEWFLGKSSEEIHKESREYLRHWINEISTVGMMEFDSPRYMYYFITPLVLLSEYARDDDDKFLFTMALELVLADYAHDYYFGNYVGAHSRVGFESPFDTRNSESSTYGDFYFEEKSTHFLPDVAFAAIASFSCPEIIRSIATKKQFPFESHEQKRGRTTLRYTYLKNALVTKKLYATEKYALGSIGGGLVSPIQQQSWSLVINTPKPNNIITGLHPYIAKEELGMFFPEEPEWQLKRIEDVKQGYSNPDKWVGGSPYETLLQNGNSIEASYTNVPSKVRTQSINIRIPAWVSISERTFRDVSMLDVDCESFKVELELPSVYERKGDSVSRCFSARFSDGAAKYSLHIQDGSKVTPSPILTDYLFYSPYIVSQRNTGILLITYGGKKRLYDFKKGKMEVD